MTTLGNGGFMVVWGQNTAAAVIGNQTGNTNLPATRAQRYDADGSPVGGEMTLATVYDVRFAKTAMLTDGSVVVVWSANQYLLIGDYFSHLTQHEAEVAAAVSKAKLRPASRFGKHRSAIERAFDNRIQDKKIIGRYIQALCSIIKSS